MHYRLHLRVHFDDGSTTDATCTVGGQFYSARSSFSAGDIVPIHFDAAHRETVPVDEPALLAEREGKRRALNEAAIERAERRLAGLPEPLGDLPTDDALRTAHERWRTTAARTREDKAEHKRARPEATSASSCAYSNTSVKCAAEDKTARERYQDLHKLRSDWTP